MDLASKNPAGGPNCDARHHAIATMLLVHGDQDPIAPIKQSEIMESALKQAGVTVVLWSRMIHQPMPWS